MFNNQRMRTLTLYAVQWVFDTNNIDVNQLKKMDDLKLGLNAVEQQQEEDQREARRGSVYVQKDNVFPERAKKPCC